MEGPTNRKQRRAAAVTTTDKVPESSAGTNTDFTPSIPRTHPSEDARFRNKPAGKTLYDIIAERQKGLQSKQEDEIRKQNPTASGSLFGSGAKPTKTQFLTLDPSTGKITEQQPGPGDSPTNVVDIIDEGGEEKSTANSNSKRPTTDSGDKNSGAQSGNKNDDDDDDDDDELIYPVFDTLLLSVTLTTLHSTLAYLAAHQYAQEIPVKDLIRESIFVAFPMLSLLIHLAHGHIVSFGGNDNNKTKNKKPKADHKCKKKNTNKNKDKDKKTPSSSSSSSSSSPNKQKQEDTSNPSLLPLTREKLTISFLRKLLFPPAMRTYAFLPLAVLLGAHLMAVTNEEPYYAVMRHAPAMGTLWVWSILELSLGPAVLGALVPLGWGMLWKGYGIM